MIKTQTGGRVMSEKKIGENGLTRRKFIKMAGSAGIAATGAFLSSGIPKAAMRDHLLIGHPTPSTGPLAAFGETSAWVADRIIAEINKEGGIFIKELGARALVKVKTVDTESNPTKAADIASKLILQDRVDLMVVLHTPDTVNPVAATCERYEIPCISSVAPIESWLTGGPYKWDFHFFWLTEDFINVSVGMWDKYSNQTSKVVGGLWPNDPDGILFAQVFTKRLKERGYPLVDVGRFPHGTQDFLAFINTWKKEKVDILTGVPTPPDWAACWRQCHQQGFIPKIATLGKPIVLPAAVNAIGSNLPNGLTTVVWWTPLYPFKSSLTGTSCKELADAWTEKTKRQWTQPLGFGYAAFEVAINALRRAGSLDKKKIREALRQTSLDTMMGHIKFNERNFSLTPLVGGQWAKGNKWPWELQIVYNRENPHIPTTAEMIFPIPRS